MVRRRCPRAGRAGLPGGAVLRGAGATAPGLFYPIIVGVIFGAGAALVVGIMRRLLHQATELRGELDEVV
ncbi:DUF2975 domain-containing protein [Microbacterium lacticum]|uniref:DUF2975 domain-containing protein n=1 Tax=Microbacterium lacticum TaxID=33885 RepID=UPI001143B304|nr:DUF2975 domain-containing protein [Microbacterium lacticum]